MKLPFSKRRNAKPDEMIAVDLGSRTSKAVHLRRARGELHLCGYTVSDGLPSDKTGAASGLGCYLANIVEKLGAKTRSLSLTVSGNDAVLRTVEAPPVSKEEFRAILKHNSRAYLQQELVGYAFDVHPLVYYSKSGPEKDPRAKPKQPKQRLLIAGAKQQLLDAYVQEAKAVGLIVECVMPGLIAPINAFEHAKPEIFLAGSVALVDIGFKASSICILDRGDLALSRVVAIGGHRLTEALSESMNISYAEAEGIKIGMATEVQRELESIIAPLGRELRASIDFFEHEHDKAISHVFICGGSARSEVFREILQTELMLECNTWDPSSFLKKHLSDQQAAELEPMGTQLSVAVGAGLSAMWSV
jgi:type IV pilus assembly protein PilM